MYIDCDSCALRGSGCDGCLVTALLGTSPGEIDWDESDRVALSVLADSGLVRPLLLTEMGRAG